MLPAILVIQAESVKLIYNNQRHLDAAIYVEAYVMHNPKNDSQNLC